MTEHAPHRSGTSAIAAVVAVAALVIIGALIFIFVLNRTDAPATAPSAQPTAGTSPSEAAIDEGILSERLTVLVIGTDIDAEREARGDPANTDALMLASVNADQSEVVLIGLPRDTVDIPLADGGTWDDKVNAILRERDLATLVGAMETLFGVPIDAHVLLDMEDFAALVDAAGGIEVDVEQPLVDPPIDLDLAAGSQALDGETALKFVRTRVDDDFERAARHQEALLALVERIAEPEAEIDLGEVLSGLDSLETDLPLDALPTLVELARRAQSAEVTREVIEPPDEIMFAGDAGDGRGYVLVPDVEAIRALVQRLIGN